MRPLANSRHDTARCPHHLLARIDRNFLYSTCADELAQVYDEEAFIEIDRPTEDALTSELPMGLGAVPRALFARLRR